MLSPSVVTDAWERRPGSDGSGSGQKPTADQVSFIAKNIIGNTLGGRFNIYFIKKKILKKAPSFYSRDQRNTSAASSTSNFLTIRCVLFLPIALKRWSNAGSEKECWAKWSAQAVLEDQS